MCRRARTYGSHMPKNSKNSAPQQISDIPSPFLSLLTNICLLYDPLVAMDAGFYCRDDREYVRCARVIPSSDQGLNELNYLLETLIFLGKVFLLPAWLVLSSLVPLLSEITQVECGFKSNRALRGY